VQYAAVKEAGLSEFVLLPLEGVYENPIVRLYINMMHRPSIILYKDESEWKVRTEDKLFFAKVWEDETLRQDVIAKIPEGLSCYQLSLPHESFKELVEGSHFYTVQDIAETKRWIDTTRTALEGGVEVMMIPIGAFEMMCQVAQKETPPPEEIDILFIDGISYGQHVASQQKAIQEDEEQETIDIDLSSDIVLFMYSLEQYDLIQFRFHAETAKWVLVQCYDETFAEHWIEDETFRSEITELIKAERKKGGQHILFKTEPGLITTTSLWLHMTYFKNELHHDDPRFATKETLLVGKSDDSFVRNNLKGQRFVRMLKNQFMQFSHMYKLIFGRDPHTIIIEKESEEQKEEKEE